MAAFGIASQVLQIVPASSKAEGPGVFSNQETDQDFLNQLQQAMDRREEALGNTAARAEAREAKGADENTPPRGESISEAAPGLEKRKESAAHGAAQGPDSDPVTSDTEAANASASADGDAASGEGEKQASESAEAPAKDDASDTTDTGETAASSATASGNGEAPAETTAGEVVTAALPGDGGTTASTAAPSGNENAADTLGTATDGQQANVSGGEGSATEAGATQAATGTVQAAVPAAEQANDDDAADTPVVAAQAPGPVLEPDGGSKVDTPVELAAAAAATNGTPGDELAAAASGAMSNTEKTSGKPGEKAGQAGKSDGPKVVLTPKSDGEVTRPTDSGNVHVADIDDGATDTNGSSQKSKGFSATSVPGNRPAEGQATQTGLQNALANVTNNQSDESNSALKLASLVNGTSTTPAGGSAAPKAGPSSSAGTPQAQAAAAASASPQALQNASNQASPLRAATPPPPPPPPPNPAAFQVAIHVARAVDDGLERINIRLHPVSLGRVEVKLEVAQDGRVTATVIADKADTLDMLQRDSRALERALQDAGLQTDPESLNFGLRGDQEDDDKDESGEGDQFANAQDEDAQDDIDVHGVIPPTRPMSAQAGALDIFV